MLVGKSRRVVEDQAITNNAVVGGGDNRVGGGVIDLIRTGVGNSEHLGRDGAVVAGETAALRQVVVAGIVTIKFQVCDGIAAVATANMLRVEGTVAIHRHRVGDLLAGQAHGQAEHGGSAVIRFADATGGRSGQASGIDLVRTDDDQIASKVDTGIVNVCGAELISTNTQFSSRRQAA